MFLILYHVSDFWSETDKTKHLSGLNNWIYKPKIIDEGHTNNYKHTFLKYILGPD